MELTTQEENTKQDKKDKQENKLRQILIETDGNKIDIKKIEVAGIYELEAIFNQVLIYIKNNLK